MKTIKFLTDARTALIIARNWYDSADPNAQHDNFEQVNEQLKELASAVNSFRSTVLKDEIESWETGEDWPWEKDDDQE